MIKEFESMIKECDQAFEATMADMMALARKNGRVSGILLAVQWLRREGFGGAASALRRAAPDLTMSEESEEE